MEIHVGNLLDVSQGIICHGCNAKGAFNAGIAKSIRERWPTIFGLYSNHLSKADAYREVVGTMFLYDTNAEPLLLIANLITQETYGRDPKVRYVSYDGVESSFRLLKKFVQEQNKEELFDVHFPLIGAGLGNGSWKVISNIIEQVFADDKRFKLHLWVLPGTVIPKD